jgi:uncharacterized membrane protein YidH (DUF202 family)
VWYFLTFAGVVIVVIGSYYSMVVRRQQQNSEFDKRAPRSVAEHPVARNPAIIMFIVFPLVTLFLGIIAWLVYEYG